MTSYPMAAWFEMREGALLTMRVQDLILRSGLGRVSKDEATELEMLASSRRSGEKRVGHPLLADAGAGAVTADEADIVAERQ